MADSVHLPSFRDYTVIARLGLGGFGTVYKAQHNYTKQLRAIKILPPGIQDDNETLKQFQDEAQAMGAFDHPHIVKIYHAGIENGFPFLDMEFIEGESVHEIIQRSLTAGKKPMVVGDVIRLAREIASALDYMHSKSLIHRDIKPQNIMRKSDGVFKLTDFGIAFEAKLSTRASDIAGTAEYMSPEQIEGDKLYAQTDLYSLGIVLYECLIGRVPFRSEGTSFSARLKLQQQILEKMPLHVRDYNTDAPGWFSDIVMKCLNKKWQERFATGSEMVKALDAGLESEKAGADAKILEAANLVNQNRYEEASGRYKEALAAFKRVVGYVSPTSSLAEGMRGQMTLCEERIEHLSERGQKVKTLREQGNVLYSQHKYAEALKVYQEVLSIYQGDAEATRQIERCEEGLREQERQRQNKIASLRQQAETQTKEFKLREARQFWQELAIVGPEHKEEVAQKVKAATDELAKNWKEHYEKEREGDAIATEGQKQFFNESFHKRSVEAYKEAQRLAEIGYDSDVNVYRKRFQALQEKIATVNQLLADFKRGMQNLRSEADRLFAAGQYTEAKKKYQQVLAGMPEDKTLADRIVECTENEIRVLREGGDRLFAEENFENAATLYKGLLELSPGDASAKARLEECKQMLDAAEQVRQLQAQQIKLLLDTGDRLAVAGNQKGALDKYQQALLLDANNATVKAKVENTLSLVQAPAKTSFFGWGRSKAAPSPAPKPAPPVVPPAPKPVPAAKAEPPKPAPVKVEPPKPAAPVAKVEPPKPAPAPPKPAAPVAKVEPPKPAPAPPKPAAPVAKVEPPKPAPVKVEPPKPVAPVAKVEPPKPAPAPPKPAAPVAKVEPPKPAAPVAKVEPPKPAPTVPPKVEPPKPAVPVAKVEPPKPAPTVPPKVEPPKSGRPAPTVAKGPAPVKPPVIPPKPGAKLSTPAPPSVPSNLASNIETTPSAAVPAKSGSNRMVLIGGGLAVVAGLAFGVMKFMGNDPAPASGGDPLVNSVGMRFVEIPKGSFTMGDENGDADAKPTHQVQLTNDFLMSRTEVTRGQFRQFQSETNYKTEAEQSGSCNVLQPNGDLGPDASGAWKSVGASDAHPMVCVSWNDAVAYVNWLNQKEKTQAYRLPTEAEWEYAARAGTTTRYHFGDAPTQLGSYGWFKENAGNEPKQVATKQANPWGLYDMNGNVYEWVSDWYGASYYANSSGQNPLGPSGGQERVLRGGSWLYEAPELANTYRNYTTPTDRNTNIGFRIVKTK